MNIVTLGTSALPVMAEAFDLPEQEIMDAAERAADSVQRLANQWQQADTPQPLVMRTLRRIARQHKVDEPAKSGFRQWMNRMTDKYWWRRSLRKRLRVVEAHQIQRGAVHRRASAYASHKALMRFERNRKRQAALLQSLEACNQSTGEVIPLQELIDASLSNPENRRKAMMARVKGVEARAKVQGHVALFLTITCPSRMHPRHASGAPNERHDGTTPRQAQAYLGRLWNRAMRQAAHQGISPYGLRVVEPHHDACPHWHVLVFVRPEHAEVFAALMRSYALADNRDLPRGMTRKGKYYYHVTTTTPRKWTPLGAVKAVALLAWARIEGAEPDPTVKTFEAIAERYLRQVIPGKALRTQVDNAKELDRLKAVFGRMQIEHIKPHHVREYLDRRGQTAKARANREKALLSHVFNKAREWGYTDVPNPCQGVKGFRELGRDRYVTDGEFAAVRAKAHPTVQDAMDIALLTGQRPADVLKIRREDIRDGVLWIVQNKTGAKRAIEITGELKAVVERINARPRERLGPMLIQDDNGNRLGVFALRSRFDKAREAAGVSFQFRDIRAKAATDTGDLAHSQMLLGHKRREMTEHYVKRRVGERVKPLR